MTVTPTLVEPGVRYFLKETLKQCHDFKYKYYSFILNIGLFIGFFLFLSIFLMSKYKGKMSPKERERKDREKHEYILSKIKLVQDEKKRISNELITGLPQWDNFGLK